MSIFLQNYVKIWDVKIQKNTVKEIIMKKLYNKNEILCYKYYKCIYYPNISESKTASSNIATLPPIIGLLKLSKAPFNS